MTPESFQNFKVRELVRLIQNQGTMHPNEIVPRRGPLPQLTMRKLIEKPVILLLQFKT